MDWKDKGRYVLQRMMRISALREPIRKLARTGVLPPAIWKRLPVEGIFSVVLPDGRSFLYSATANDGIARALYWRGLEHWESESIPVFYRLARSARLVLDVGANTGFYTLLACAANDDCRVLSFEPVPRVLRNFLNISG